MRNRREMGTPQAQNPISVISRLMVFSCFFHLSPQNENHPSLEVPEKRIFRTRKRGLQYKSQSYFVLLSNTYLVVLDSVSFFNSIPLVNVVVGSVQGGLMWAFPPDPEGESITASE